MLERALRLTKLSYEWLRIKVDQWIALSNDLALSIMHRGNDTGYLGSNCVSVNRCNCTNRIEVDSDVACRSRGRTHRDRPGKRHTVLRSSLILPVMMNCNCE